MSLDIFHQVMSLVVMVCGHHGLWPSWSCNSHIQAYTMTATRCTMMATAMKTWKTNGVLLRNRQIHDIVGHILPGCVFCHGHGLWPSWSLFVAVMVCGHHGLWPSLSNPCIRMSLEAFCTVAMWKHCSCKHCRNGTRCDAKCEKKCINFKDCTRINRLHSFSLK